VEAEVKPIDARRTAKELWEKFHCFKLRLSDGSVRVVTYKWWEQFLSKLSLQ
jgi:hypothetical protein